MKRYLSEKALDAIVSTYNDCIQELRLADNNFKREYWKGKRAGVIETFCYATDQSRPNAEHMLEQHRKDMLAAKLEKEKK